MIDTSSDQISECKYEWRVVRHEAKCNVSLSKLAFTSNKQDPSAIQPPGFTKFPLRLEQLRSLSWMLKQESSIEPYLEEEVVESILPSMQWRAEGKAVRPVIVRGGIIADEVSHVLHVCLGH